MPRYSKQDYLDDAYEDSDDADDGYKKAQHPTSKYAKGLRSGAKQQELDDEEVIESVDVDPNFHRFVIGRQGIVKQELEVKFDCVIDIPRKESHERKIYVNGRRADCKKVIDEIKSIVAKEKAKSAVATETTSFPALPGQEIVTVSVDFEKSAIGLFIGQGGSRARDLKSRLSSRGENIPLVNQEVGVEVILPDRNDTSSIITVKVPKHVAHRAEGIIREFCSFYELLPHLKGVSVAGSVGSVLKGDDGASRGEKADRTKNKNSGSAVASPTTTTTSSSSNVAASSPATPATKKSTSTSSVNNSSNQNVAAAAADTTIAAVDAGSKRPERKFPAFIDSGSNKYMKHQALECRF